jgi:hypothetical protein
VDWTVLGEHAVTRYSGNPLTRYAISGKSAVGYAELEPGVGWSYWEFRTPSDKKDTKPVEPKRHDGVFPSALAAMKSALG